MSKIERSGVDTSALQGLISGSGSAQASPHKQRDSDATSGTSKDEEDEFVDAMEEVEDVLDELETELEAEFQCALEQEEDLPGATDCNQSQDTAEAEDPEEADDKRAVEPEVSEQDDEELENSDEEEDEEEFTVDPEVQKVLEGMLHTIEEEGEYVNSDDEEGDAKENLEEELEEKPEHPFEDVALQEASYLETEIVIDVQGVQFESETRTELVDAYKSNTTIVDLTTSHARGEGGASAASQDSKARRKSKKKAKVRIASLDGREWVKHLTISRLLRHCRAWKTMRLTSWTRKPCRNARAEANAPSCSCRTRAPPPFFLLKQRMKSPSAIANAYGKQVCLVCVGNANASD